MRQLNTHLTTGAFNALQVTAVDNPPPGFANVRYDITGFNTVYNSTAACLGGMPARFTRLPIIFHTGPISYDMPMNGVTPEALLAVISDHLNGLQNSPEACMENQMAKDYVDAALSMLLQRHPKQNQAAAVVSGVLSRATALTL